MRGKGSRKFVFPTSTGITPAYAGKSLAEFGKTSKAWDHPRLCGEKWLHNYGGNFRRGSPPPMRGKAFPIFIPIAAKRITPAYAGKSVSDFHSDCC